MELVGQNSEILKQIPIVKWLLLGNDVRSRIQSAFFIKKYANFIGPIGESTLANPGEIKKLEKLYQSDRDYRRLIESSIIELDKYQTEIKARLLGILFVKTIKDDLFSVAEYNSILYSIENMHPYTGIECLRQYYDYRKRFESAMDEKTKRQIWTEGAGLDYSPLSGTGFLTLPKGGAYIGDIGGAFLNDLGKRFYENVVVEFQSSE